MIGSTTVDYVAALVIALSSDQARRKPLLVAALTFNLGVLGFFKYAKFFLDSCTASALIG